MSADDYPPSDEPLRALILAQALDACIEAERHQVGSADRLIARQPAWADVELRRLVLLAQSLDAVAADAVLDDEFRAAARQRLMQRIGGERVNGHSVGSNGHVAGKRPDLLHAHPLSKSGPARGRRRARWLRRGALGGLLAAALAAAATLTASASNALPGDPIYSVKQVQEAIAVRIAPDDHARALVLLGEADTRLSETARLLQEGRTDAVAQTTAQFDNAVDQATTVFVVTIAAADTADPSASAPIESRLSDQQDALQAMLATAPEPAKPHLREALLATERDRAMVAPTNQGEPTANFAETVVAAPEPTVSVPAAVAIGAPPAPRSSATDAPTIVALLPRSVRAVDRHEEWVRAETTEVTTEMPPVAVQPAAVAPGTFVGPNRPQTGGNDGGKQEAAPASNDQADNPRPAQAPLPAKAALEQPQRVVGAANQAETGQEVVQPSQDAQPVVAYQASSGSEGDNSSPQSTRTRAEQAAGQPNADTGELSSGNGQAQSDTGQMTTNTSTAAASAFARSANGDAGQRPQPTVTVIASTADVNQADGARQAGGVQQAGAVQQAVSNVRAAATAQPMDHSGATDRSTGSTVQNSDRTTQTSGQTSDHAAERDRR